MRVLQLIDSLEAGGAERMAVNLANGLLPYVKASFLCATRKEGGLKTQLNPSIGYTFLNKKSIFDFKAIIILKQFITKHDITIIHAHSSSFFLATLMRFFIPNLKVVWHDHYGNSEFIEKRPYLILKICSRYFYHVFAVNSVLQKWVETKLDSKHVSYLPNFAVISNVKTIITTTLKGDDGKRILCLANLRPQKDHFTLINAFKMFQKQFPQWTLHCVGQDFGDDYSEAIHILINELDLKDSIFLYGSRTDTNAIIRQCNIGVLSSQSEGLPLALLEYGLGELAVVTTNVGDCNHVVVNDAVGQLIKPNSSVDLLNAFVRFAKEDTYRLTSAKALKTYVENHFSEENVINKIIEVYRAI